MIIPVRCFSCGRVIASDYEKYKERITELKSKGESIEASNVEAILDELGLERYCCRRMIISHTDLIDEIIPFS